MSSFLRMHSHCLRLRARGRTDREREGGAKTVKVYPGAQVAGQEHSGKDRVGKHLAVQTSGSSGGGGGLIIWQ